MLKNQFCNQFFWFVKKKEDPTIYPCNCGTDEV